MCDSSGVCVNVCVCEQCAVAVQYLIGSAGSIGDFN